MYVPLRCARSQVGSLASDSEQAASASPSAITKSLIEGRQHEATKAVKSSAGTEETHKVFGRNHLAQAIGPVCSLSG